MSVKFSNTYKAKVARIKKIPEIADNVILSVRKTDANNMVKNFRNGIKNNSLGLIPLADSTISTKKFKGLSKPSTPLYGYGKSKTPNSLFDALYVRTLKNGYKVVMSTRKHHEANMSLKKLLLIHENGVKIKRGNGVIIIPPRHPFLKAYQKTLIGIKNNKKETSRYVKKAIMDYVKYGKTDVIKQMKKTVGE